MIYKEYILLRVLGNKYLHIIKPKNPLFLIAYIVGQISQVYYQVLKG